MMVRVKLEHVEHGLRVSGVVFLCDVGLGEQFRPLIGHALEGYGS